MRRELFKLCFLAILPAAMTACAETQENSSNSCSVDVCKDSNTLLACDVETGIATEKACEVGCRNGACKDKCTSDYCMNANTLVVCNPITGASLEKPCEHGCDAGKCKSATNDTKCTADACKDASTLLVCDTTTGKAAEKTCEHGCDAGKCKEVLNDTKCVADACKDASTLLVCDTTTGKATEKTCEHGCDAGKCKAATNDTKCTADACKDASTLLVCDTTTGKATEKPCTYGCQSERCNQTPQVGTACNPIKFESLCEGNTAYFCNASNKVDKESCDSLTCFLDHDLHEAWCGTTNVERLCQAEGDTFYIGDDQGKNMYCAYASEGYAFYGTCMKDDAGVMYGVGTYGGTICKEQDGKTYAVYCNASGELVGQTCNTSCKDELDGANCDGSVVSVVGSVPPASEAAACLEDSSDCTKGHGSLIDLGITYEACSAAEAASCTEPGLVCVKSTISGSTTTSCMPVCNTIGQKLGMCDDSGDRAAYYSFECKQIGSIKAMVITQGSLCEAGGSTSSSKFVLCSEYDSKCAANSIAVCNTAENTYMCYEQCTTPKETRTTCDTYYTSADRTSTADFTSEEICGTFSGKNIWLSLAESDDDYIECKTTCNAEGTACK